MENVNKIRMVWMEHPEIRLQEWRAFRQDVATQSLAEQCSEVQLWWNLAPRSNISIDPYDMESWPGPWDMVYEGDTCKFSAALGMSYTIFCIDKDVPNTIMRVNDLKNNDMYMVTVIDDTWVLNYNTCEVALWKDVKDSLQVQESWLCSDVVNATHS